MKNNQYWIGYLIGIILAFFIVSLILMWLWNGLMPFLLNLPLINYCQSMALYMITNILFGSIGYKGVKIGNQ